MSAFNDLCTGLSVFDQIFQPNVRQSAASALNAMVDKAGLVVFIEAELFSEALKVENPILRMEVRTHTSCLCYFVSSLH